MEIHAWRGGPEERLRMPMQPRSAGQRQEAARTTVNAREVPDGLSCSCEPGGR
jgi:hypothetical protein